MQPSPLDTVLSGPSTPPMEVLHSQVHIPVSGLLGTSVSPSNPLGEVKETIWKDTKELGRKLPPPPRNRTAQQITNPHPAAQGCKVISQN